jgi:nicotinamidase-related amidase
MALTNLDPKTALILIDLQKGVLALPTVHPAEDVLKQAASLADAFRRHALPVVLVNVVGGAPGRSEQKRSQQGRPPDWTVLAPELKRQPQDYLVVKRSWGAFANTGLKELLEKLGVTQIVLAGISTSIGVESTARQAYDYGFNVALAVDAMTDTSIEAHINSVEQIFPRLGETCTTGTILTLLDT